MEFQCFYTDLYNIQPTSSRIEAGEQVEEMRQYIKESTLPTFPPDVAEKLEGWNTIEEINK